MQQRHVVFGGSGFIGTHLIRHLVAAGDHVISVDKRPPRHVFDGVDYRLADVRDLSDLALKGPINRFYNLAAVHTTPGHPTHEYYDTNINGALQVTKLAEHSGVDEIVFTSSISVYGPSEDIKTEDSIPAPVSAYGYSKLLAERVHEDWLHRNEARKLTVVRPAVVFGPGEDGNFTRLAKLLRKGFFVYPGRKDTVKACIYVEDLLEAIAFAHRRPERYVLFNAAYPNRYTLEDIVGTLIRNYFPKTREFLLPGGVVTVVAAMLRPVSVANVGIHPDRVTKLVRSTNIYPKWLEGNSFNFPKSLDPVLARWEKETGGTFV
jgi:nucleoside-diphosphate-sugar epimerase